MLKLIKPFVFSNETLLHVQNISRSISFHRSKKLGHTPTLRKPSPNVPVYDVNEFFDQHTFKQLMSEIISEAMKHH